MSKKDVTFVNRIAPRKFKSSILSWNQLDVLWEWLPDTIYIKEPLIAFCSDENGMNTIVIVMFFLKFFSSQLKHRKFSSHLLFVMW